MSYQTVFALNLSFASSNCFSAALLGPRLVYRPRQYCEESRDTNTTTNAFPDVFPLSKVLIFSRGGPWTLTVHCPKVALAPTSSGNGVSFTSRVELGAMCSEAPSPEDVYSEATSPEDRWTSSGDVSCFLSRHGVADNVILINTNVSAYT